jgi:putative ABC transport system permease protein
MKDHPPHLALCFLAWFCPPSLYESIEGDLLEQFEEDVKLVGEKKAKRWFVWNVLKFFRLGILLRNRFSFGLNQGYMVQSHFKVAYRHLIKDKSFTAINVVGLSVGITAFLLIMQYVSFELSFDNIHENKDQIYRIAYEQYENGELKNNSARNFVGIQNLLKENFPEVKACTGFDRTSTTAGFLFGYQDKTFYITEPFYQADSNFFKVFPSLLIQGDTASVLKDQHNLVISEKLAKQIFGDANPLGKRLENKSPSFADVSEFVISGVLKDVPENAHFHLSFVALIHGDEITAPNYWRAPKLYSYLTIGQETNPGDVSDKINRLLKKLENENPNVKGAKVFLQPISDIHLQSKLHDELEPNGNKTLNNIILAIGLIILVLAWINYVNIETARFISRTKEVGVRRVIGSAKSDLALQFVVEYFCITVLAGVTAIILFRLILPHFNYLTGVPIDSFRFSIPKIWVMGGGLFFVGTIIAGVHPALFLLQINPMAMLRGKFKGTNRGVWLRKSLMVFQFTTSLALITFLLVIREQLGFMRLTNKKIDLERIVSIRNPTVYANADDSVNYSEFSAFKIKLLENHLIGNVTSSSVVPGAEIDEYFTNRLKRNLNDPIDPTRYRILFVDYDFIPFYKLKLTTGRNYSTEMGDEENWNRIILNEKAVFLLGFNSTKEAINQDVNFHLWGNDFIKYRIVGIVEDYHQEASKKEVEPIVLSLNHNRFQQVFYSVKLNAGVNPQEGLACIEKSWKEIFPDKPFEYYFQDDYYDKQFKSEIYFERIFALFSGVAVFIACLGILGLTLFEANTRLKEISIRKVLGASISNLFGMLSKDYFRLIILSSIISIPLIYCGSSRWLINYPLRIEVSSRFFLLPLISVGLLAILFSGIQILKAARSNPVNSLKSE